MFDAKDDFRLRRGFIHHPKIALLRRQLGDGGIISLILLWDFTAGNRYDGSLAGMTDDEIEAAAEWAGERGAWISAAVSLRLVDGEQGKREVHSWHEHQPWISQREGRVALARESGRIGGLASAALRQRRGGLKRPLKAPSSDPSSGKQPPSPALPSPTQPNQREEKTPEVLTAKKVAQALKDQIGATSLPACLSQIKSLQTSGLPLDAILAAVSEHGTPGMAPWDFSKAASGTANRIAPAKNVPNPAEILEVGRKLSQNGHAGLFLKGGPDVA